MSYETKLTAHAFDLSPPMDIIPMAPIRVGLLVSWETGPVLISVKVTVLPDIRFSRCLNSRLSGFCFPV